MSARPLQEESIADKWTYPNVYYIRELKDILNIIIQQSFNSLDEVVTAVERAVLPEGKAWASRRVYEYVNALLKFKLITKEYKPLVYNSHPSAVNEYLSESELAIFIQVFFSFSRFRQFIQLFLTQSHSPLLPSTLWTTLQRTCQNDSRSVFSFLKQGKYISHFMQVGSQNIFFINQSDLRVMSFWNVFSKWGHDLHLMSSFRIKDLPPGLLKAYLMQQTESDWKQVSFTYFHQDIMSAPDIRIALAQFALSKHVYIPDAVLAVLLVYRLPLTTALEAVTAFIRDNANDLSYERTSEIFIKNAEKPFFPIINDSFISHFYLRR